MIDLILHGIFWFVGFALLYRIPKFNSKSTSETMVLPVSIIIPARNEETRIPALLQSLKNQCGPDDEVLIVDDHSDDKTARIAEDFGFTVIPSAPLPPGWLGKPWACWQAAQRAQRNMLLFLDADTRFETDGLNKLKTAMTSKGGAISILPYHIPLTWVEELSALFNVIQLISCGAFTVFGHRIKDTRPFGPVLMMSKEDYFRCGGHEAVKNQVVENFMLAGKLRDNHIHLTCAPGQGLISYRMYPDGFKSLVNGWTKSFSHGAQKTPLWLLLALVLWLMGALGTCRHAVTILFQPVSPYFLAVLCAIMVLYIFQIRIFLKTVGTFHWLTSIFFPIPFLFFVVVFARALFFTFIKRPSQWKGRSIS